MALRCLWGFSRAAQRNVRAIHRADVQPSKIPLTDEEKKVLEKLGEPDKEIRGYLNELYTEFDVVAEKRKERKDQINSKDKEDKDDTSPPPKYAARSSGLSTNFCRGFHRTSSILDEYKMKPSQGIESEELKDEAEIVWDHQETMTDYYPENRKANKWEGMDLTRGEEGVFDIKELVDILEQEKLQDVAVIEVPSEYSYADYLVLCTMISTRQSKSITQFLKKMYKCKRNPDDFPLKIEGADSPDWKVMDMGNIVLHLFSEETREKYDIESLWTVGSEFDEVTIGKERGDDDLDTLSQHMEFVRSLKPADKNFASV